MKSLLIALRSQTLTNALTEALDSRFDVHTCRTGEEVRSLAAQLQLDVLVIDLRLPDSDGLSVLERCQHKPSAILMLTDLCSREILRRATRAGVGSLIILPCSVRYIAQTLEQITEKCPSRD